MILYKYLEPERIDVLEDRLIRFTQPRSLNDPFESFPYLLSLTTPEKANSIASMIWDEVFSEWIPNLPLHQQALLKAKPIRDSLQKIITEAFSKGFRFDVPDIRPMITSLLMDIFNSRLGILSLSEDPKALLMWAHYAAEHTGFLVGFDTTHPYFDQELEYRRITRYFDKVKYSSIRPPIVLGIEPGDKKAAKQFILDAFFTKSSAWQHEKEWRMVRELEDADQQKEYLQDDAEADPIFLFGFPANLVKVVVTGCRMTENSLDRINKVLQQPDYSHVDLQRATLDETLFCLNFERFDA